MKNVVHCDVTILMSCNLWFVEAIKVRIDWLKFQVMRQLATGKAVAGFTKWFAYDTGVSFGIINKENTFFTNFKMCALICDF